VETVVNPYFDINDFLNKWENIILVYVPSGPALLSDLKLAVKTEKDKWNP
jgi:hypothetical protein